MWIHLVPRTSFSFVFVCAWPLTVLAVRRHKFRPRRSSRHHPKVGATVAPCRRHGSRQRVACGTVSRERDSKLFFLAIIFWDFSPILRTFSDEIARLLKKPLSKLAVFSPILRTFPDEISRLYKNPSRNLQFTFRSTGRFFTVDTSSNGCG